MSEPELRCIDSRVVYRNRWMTVREDRVRRISGEDGLFGIVDKPDFSLIVPFDGERFHLVQQYRYPVDGRFWEFPQGSLEGEPDASPEQVATAELQEETGILAGKLEPLGRLFQAYGYSNQGVHVFLANGLQAGEASPEAEEHGMISGAFTRRECEAMIDGGSIADLATLAAFHLFDRHARRWGGDNVAGLQTTL
ncbi:NUDIX domain-containing protein [Granulosicoccus sp. 3-233]|uniref:NUDIX domain-containing protein n=1 Tax=Granulosicoccus sp. 3-233 TaxID=3417969 RepID=UPI003D3485BD